MPYSSVPPRPAREQARADCVARQDAGVRLKTRRWLGETRRARSAAILRATTLVIRRTDNRLLASRAVVTPLGAVIIPPNRQQRYTSTRGVLLPLPTVPWQITGNHWLSLPCIHPADASIHAIGMLHRAAR